MTERMLTDKAIRALSTAKAQEDVRLGGVPGLVLRVSKTGRKTFMYVYAPPASKHLPRDKRTQRRLTIGLYPETSLAEARAKAKGYQGDLSRGIDPQGHAEKASASPSPTENAASVSADEVRLRVILGDTAPLPGTFAHLAAEYLLRHAWAKKKRTRDDEGMLRRDLIPAWGARSAEEIRRRDVVALLDRIVGRGAPIAARATKMLLSKLYNFGLARDLVEHNPTVGVEVPQSKAREVWLRDHEVKVLWQNLDRRQLVTASIFRAILLTAQRPGEVCSMEWQEVRGLWWELPAGKTKNGHSHRVYLARHMQALLALLRPVTGSSRYVFQSRISDSTPSRCINKVGYSICSATGLSFTPHDLRRTAATHLGELGFGNEVIDAVLNHKGRGVVKTYNRYGFDREKEEALTAWDEKVGRLVGSPAP